MLETERKNNVLVCYFVKVWVGIEFLKDETILSIGMMSIALGILIGRFLHLEYAGFSITDFVKAYLSACLWS